MGGAARWRAAERAAERGWLRLHFLTVVCVALVSMVASRPAEDKKEPVYEGKALSEWVKMLQDPDEKTRLKAVQALGKIGRKAGTATNESYITSKPK